jgi:hypothetical protein
MLDKHSTTELHPQSQNDFRLLEKLLSVTLSCRASPWLACETLGWIPSRLKQTWDSDIGTELGSKLQAFFRFSPFFSANVTCPFSSGYLGDRVSQTICLD